MTTLPATIDFMQYEVECAVELVEQKLRDRTANERFKTKLREELRKGFADRVAVIESAERGDEIADAALWAEYQELADTNIPVPATLTSYILRAARRKPHRKRGSHKWWTNVQRDIGILALVALTSERFNLAPTRNSTSEGPCGASLVAIALKRRGFKISEKRIANIWAERSQEAVDHIALFRIMFPSIPR
jgi:hypothetical protein